MSRFCNTCTFWAKDAFTRVGQNFGTCSNTHVAGAVVHDGEQRLYEGQVYTEQYFGCVHHRSNSGILMNISKIIKK